MKRVFGRDFQNINLDGAIFIDPTTGQSVNFEDYAQNSMRESLERRQSSIQLQRRSRAVNEHRYANFSSSGIMEPSLPLMAAMMTIDAATGSNFDVIEKRLAEIESYGEQEDFSCITSDFAKQIVDNVIRAAYKITPDFDCIPLIAADGNGGLKFDWRKNNKEVRFTIPADPNSTSYIYFRGETDDIIDNPDAETLSDKLIWLK